MSIIKHKKYIAFKCEKCGTISVFPSERSDGNTCIECGKYIAPIGEARVHDKNNMSMTMSVNVDTTQLDEALKKADKLYKVFCDINNIPPTKK